MDTKLAKIYYSPQGYWKGVSLRIGSAINCAKLLLSKNEFNFPPTSLFPDGFATS